MILTSEELSRLRDVMFEMEQYERYASRYSSDSRLRDEKQFEEYWNLGIVRDDLRREWESTIMEAARRRGWKTFAEIKKEREAKLGRRLDDPRWPLG